MLHVTDTWSTVDSMMQFKFMLVCQRFAQLVLTQNNSETARLQWCEIQATMHFNYDMLKANYREKPRNTDVNLW